MIWTKPVFIWIVAALPRVREKRDLKGKQLPHAWKLISLNL